MNKFIYNNQKCVGEVVDDYFYTTRSIFGIFNAYFIEVDVLQQLLDMGIEYIMIDHRGGGQHENALFRCKLSLFYDDNYFISHISPLNILQRGVKVNMMEKVN